MKYTIGYYNEQETSVVVTSGGHVIDRMTGIEPKYNINKQKNYLTVNIGILKDDNGKDLRYMVRKEVFLHQLVAMTFLPLTILADHINHIDMNKRNNRVENLEWLTYSELMQKHHKLKTIQNTSLMGYSEKDIRSICKYLSTGTSINKISQLTGISSNIISMVRTHDIGNAISSEYIFRLPEDIARQLAIPISYSYKTAYQRRKSSLDEDMVHMICKIYEQGGLPKDAMDATGATKAACTAIYQRRSWGDITSQYKWERPIKGTYDMLHEMIWEMFRYHWTPTEIANMCHDAAGMSKADFLAIVHQAINKFYILRKKGEIADKYPHYSANPGFDPIRRTASIIKKIDA